jgi:hypothetical protein
VVGFCFFYFMTRLIHTIIPPHLIVCVIWGIPDVEVGDRHKTPHIYPPLGQHACLHDRSD